MELRTPLSWSASLTSLCHLLDSGTYMWMQALRRRPHVGIDINQFDADLHRIQFTDPVARRYALQHFEIIQRVDNDTFGIGHGPRFDRMDWVAILKRIRSRLVHRCICLMEREVQDMRRVAGCNSTDEAVILMHFLQFVADKTEKFATTVVF